MKQHDFYFIEQEDACKALVFIRDEVTPLVTLSDGKLTFFTKHSVNLIEQVVILQHVRADKPIFNMQEVKQVSAQDSTNKQPDLRPRLIDLWYRLRFRSDTLAEKAGVPESTVLAMFRNEAVSREVAVQVLSALSAMLGRDYTLSTVKVNLIREQRQSVQPGGNNGS